MLTYFNVLPHLVKSNSPPNGAVHPALLLLLAADCQGYVLGSSNLLTLPKIIVKKIVIQTGGRPNLICELLD